MKNVILYLPKYAREGEIKIYLTYESIYVINGYTVKIVVDQKIHTEF